LALVVLAALAGGIGCAKPEDVKLEHGYVGGEAQLLFPTKGRFLLSFRAGSGWDTFGPLQGETTRFGDKLWLLPQELNFRTEEQIAADAMRDAQQTGKQTDLMAVRKLMTKVELQVSKDGKTLKVIEPVLNPKDPHPLGGVMFSASL